MNAGWQTIRFCDLGRVFNGNSISEADKKKYFAGQVNGLPYIATKDVGFDHSINFESGVRIPEGKQSDFKLAPANTVLVCAEGGSAGRKIAHSNAPIFFGNKLFAISPSHPHSSRFVFYYCLSGAFSKKFRAAMAGLIGGVSINKFKELTIQLPAAAEQHRIVAILDEAFDGIATAKANAEKNLQNARAVFESYLQKVFTRTVNEVPLSDLANDITDGDHSPPPKAPSGVPFITISDIVKQSREIDFSNTFTVSEAYFRNLKPNKKPQIGDVLYTVTGATLGIPVLVKEQRDFCFQRHIGLVRPKPSTDSAWLTYALLSPQVFRQATIGSTGAAQKTVSLKVLRNIKVPKIGLDEQTQIALQLDALTAETQRLESLYQQKLAALDDLKKTLLHQAFSGAL